MVSGYPITSVTSPHIPPVIRNLAQDRGVWTLLWSEKHSRSYSWSEEQVQVRMDQPEPGQARNVFCLFGTRRTFNLIFSTINRIGSAGLVKYAG
jgi:hypothetical protein